jgi:hypothetical protein
LCLRNPGERGEEERVFGLPNWPKWNEEENGHQVMIHKGE